MVFSKTEVLQKLDSYKLAMKQKTQVWTGGQTGEHLVITLKMCISPLNVSFGVWGPNRIVYGASFFIDYIALVACMIETNYLM